MVTIIGVRFRRAGKIYFFSPEDFQIEKGMHVIVETARGVEYGLVAIGNKEINDEEVVHPLKPVIRIADKCDDEVNRANKESEKEALSICLEKVKKHGLSMKLIACEYTFDRGKLMFYFTADGRVDFRELVKDLAYVFRTRIELRQIGVRDETKMKGGIGMCGRPLCCNTFLSEFIPVSIKMAKDQNFSLNPSKLSGVCGRLMCCLKHEEVAYEYLNSLLPDVGDFVETADGFKGEVSSIIALKQLVRVIVEPEEGTKEIREYKVSDIKFKPKKKKKDDIKESDEIRRLEALERAESKAHLD